MTRKRQSETLDLTVLTRYGWARVAFEVRHLVSANPIPHEAKSYARGGRSYLVTDAWAGVVQETPEIIAPHILAR